MNASEFLLNLLYDSYYEYCNANGMTDNEFDLQFLDEDGSILEDINGLIKNRNVMLDDMVIDYVYCMLSEAPLPDEINKLSLFNSLFGSYYLSSYKKDSSITNFLKNSNINEIIDLFNNNYDFGIEVMKSYYNQLVDSKLNDKNRENIYKNNDQDKLLEYESGSYDHNVTYLNDILRKVILNLYNTYISIGANDIEALSLTWNYFVSDFDPLNELENMGYSDEEIAFYKRYMINLIFSDVYEDSLNESIINSDNYDDRLANFLPVITMSLGFVSIPGDANIRNRLLKHFILLQNEKEKMKENRRKTYIDGRQKILSRYNPFYKIDELNY